MALYFLFIKFRNVHKSINFFSILSSVSRVSTRDVTGFKVGYLPNTEHERTASCLIQTTFFPSVSFLHGFLCFLSICDFFLLFLFLKTKRM